MPALFGYEGHDLLKQPHNGQGRMTGDPVPDVHTPARPRRKGGVVFFFSFFFFVVEPSKCTAVQLYNLYKAFFSSSILVWPLISLQKVVLFSSSLFQQKEDAHCQPTHNNTGHAGGLGVAMCVFLLRLTRPFYFESSSLFIRVVLLTDQDRQGVLPLSLGFPYFPSHPPAY